MPEAKQKTSVDETNITSLAKRSRGVSWRSIILGAALIPPNAYWVMCVEGIYHKGHPSVMALPWNAVFNILVMVIVNQLIKKLAPRFAFSQAELVTIYVMVWTVTMLAGHDSLQLGIPSMSLAYYFSNDTNRWYDLFATKLPAWLTVSDPDVIRGFYEGGDTFHKWHYVRAWIKPVLWWTSFIIALGSVTICINIILRKQWTENERLSYPIAQLPLAITKDGGSSDFWKNRLLWIGILIGAGIDLINGLHFLHPNIPYIQVRHDAINLAENITTTPWNGIGWLPLPLYPFIICLGYMLPVDMSFSIWFFFLFRKFQDVFLTAFPLVEDRGAYYSMQSFGALVTYTGFALWMARGHLKGVWRRVMGIPGGVDDSEEPVSYRFALIGILIAGGYLIWFSRQMGFSASFVLIIFAVYFLVTVAITRFRAELGPPAHEMCGMDATTIASVIVGSKLLGATNLALYPLFFWFCGRGYRTSIAPGQLEGFRMAYEAKASPRRLGWAMLIAIALGALATYWASLTLHYSTRPQSGNDIHHSLGVWMGTAGRINNPKGPDFTGILSFMGAIGFTSLLFYMRHMASWWPFHPAGYALSMTFGVEYYWSCMLIAWILKLATLRFSGLKGYRSLLPLAFGIIIGEYLIGAMWSMVSIKLGQFIYDFSPG